MEILIWLQFFGITPQQITPILLVNGLLVFALWKFFLKHIKEETIDLHHVTKEIQKHLHGKAGWSPQHVLSNRPNL